jgi:hypothetical protein
LTPCDDAAQESISTEATGEKPAVKKPKEIPPHPANRSMDRIGSPARIRASLVVITDTNTLVDIYDEILPD